MSAHIPHTPWRQRAAVLDLLDEAIRANAEGRWLPFRAWLHRTRFVEQWRALGVGEFHASTSGTGKGYIQVTEIHASPAHTEHHFYTLP